MKTDILHEKSKEYWENQFPDLRKLYIKKVYYKTIGSTLILSSIFFLYPFLNNQKDSIGGWFSLGLLFIFVFVAYFSIGRFYFSYYVNHPEKDEIYCTEMKFYDISGMYGHLYGAYPEKDPINKIFPDDMIVSQFALYYKTDKRKYKYLRKQCVFFIGTKEKQEELKQLIHIKEGIVPRKESRVFNVRFRKHSKELVEIQLSKEEEYPNISYYEDCIERINRMF